MSFSFLLRQPSNLLIVLACLLTASPGHAVEGIITSGAMTGDADSGVNAAKTYLALGNIVGGDVTVNGVTFLGTGTSGTGWALSGAGNQFGSGGNHTTTFGSSTIDNLFDGFQYNGNPGTLTLSGLTAGQTYVATLYNEAWVLGADRTQTITAGDGSSLVYNEDALEASVVRYTFVATGASTTLNFTPTGAGSMHFYGMSTEQVFNNTWTAASGNSWNTAANWSSVPVNNSIPNSVGANASFAAQGAPTAVTLDSATIVGHVQFLGSGNYTVSGANTLTIQANAGGVTVLKADAGVHTLATPIQLNSAISKFGAGTIKLGGAITGSNKGINLANGALIIESSTADISSLGAVSNAGTFSISSAVPQTYDGTISGAGTFEKSGSDILTLKREQLYTGPTIISGGTLKLTPSVSINIANPSFQTYTALANGSYGYQPAGASWTFGTNAGINLNGGPFFSPTNHDGTAGGFVQGTGGGISQTVTVTDAGTYTFSFQGVSRTTNGPNGILFQIDGNTVRSISPAEFSQISWADFKVQVALTAGSHTIAFVGNNTLGGDRTSAIDNVSGQTGGRLPSTTAVNLTASGATLDLSGISQVVGSLAGVAGSSVINDGAFIVGGDNTSTLFAGGISGTGSLTKNGSGTLAVGGANSYSGATTVNTGTIQLAGGTIPSATALQLASGGTFDLNGGAQTVASLSGAAGSAITLGSGNFTVGNASASTHAGSLSGTGTLTKVGNGALTLSGPTSYSGGTTISTGSVRSQSSNTSNVGVVSVASGATWDLTTVSHTVSGLTGAGAITRQGVLSTGADGAALISSSKNYLLKLDFGNNGGATVNGVAFDTAGNTGTGFTLSGAGSLFGGTDTGGYDQLMGDFIYGGNPATLTFSNLTVGQTYEAVLYTKIGSWANRAQNATFDDDGAGPNSQVLLNTDPGTLGYYAYRFVAPSTTMSVNMAPVVPANTFHWFGASLESVATAAQSLTIGSASNYAFTGVISGPTTLIKQGAGTQELSGASTYTGGTSINGGFILAHHPQALSTGNVAIASGANYLAWWKTANSAITNNFTLNGLGGASPGGDKAAIYADGGGPGGLAEYTLMGNITLAATSNLGGNNLNNLRVSGPISGPGGLTKGGGRTDENNALILGNPANNYAGETLVTKGTLKLAASEVIPNGAGKGGLTLNANTTLDLGGFSETVNRLSGSGNIVSTASVGTPVNFTDDATSGISSAKTYSHALDFAEGSPVTINGVVFAGAGLTGANFSLTGASPSAGNGATGATGNVSRLLTNFYYNGNPATLTLSGLISGQAYEARLYERAWGGNRTQLFTVNAGGGTGTTIYNEDYTSVPSYIPFRYTADSSGQVVITTNMLGDGTYHWYAASNEMVAGSTLTFGDDSDQIFSGAISGPTSLTKQGSGTQTFTGTNTYTGPTNLTGGTLLMGSAGAFSSASNLTLSGATLAAGGYTNIGGVLSQTTGSNVIDFANGNGQLTFTNTGLWTGGLSIWNYDGSPWTSGIDKLIFTANGLTVGDLNNIHFYTGPGTGQIDNGDGATFLPSGELVPVPEPAACGSAIGLLMLGLLREGRRRRQMR